MTMIVVEWDGDWWVVRASGSDEELTRTPKRSTAEKYASVEAGIRGTVLVKTKDGRSGRLVSPRPHGQDDRAPADVRRRRRRRAKLPE